MKWVKFRIKTVTEAEDIIISTLYDIGLEGAQIEDKVPLTALEKEQMFVDILPEGPKDDGIAYLNFYVEEDTDETELLERVKAELILPDTVEAPVVAGEGAGWLRFTLNGMPVGETELRYVSGVNNDRAERGLFSRVLEFLRGGPPACSQAAFLCTLGSMV